MTSKAPMKDIVVILPGILGSVLQKDGKDLWAVSGQAVWDVFTHSEQTLRHLRLSQDDPEAESLGDGDGTVPKVSAIPLERSKDLNNFFIAEQHGGLQKQSQVLDSLLNTLRLSQYNLSEVRAPQTAIGLRGCLKSLRLCRLIPDPPKSPLKRGTLSRILVPPFQGG